MTITVTRNPNLTRPQKNLHIENEVKKNFNSIYQKNWWTGLSPSECPGFDKERNCLVALPLLNLDICTREDILDYFNNSWTLTELLFQGIKTEETYVRSPYHGLRHPMMFYYGHTAVIYVNKMRIAGLLKEPINLFLEKILETGVDEMSWDDMSKNEMAWPKLIEVHQYRKTVYDLIVNMIKTHPDFDFKDQKRNLLQNSPWWALWMGLEHEKIHFETSSVLIRELPLDLVETPEYFAPMHPSRSENQEIKNEWIVKNGSKVTIGKSETEPSFGWDNEFGSRTLSIKDFSYTKFQITNREYFDFVASGAYVLEKYWAQEGREWRKFRNTKRPTFWCAVGPEGAHEYELRTIFEVIPMPWNFPAEVNYHEAIAYCNWKKEQDKSKMNYRLMTEGEYISLRSKETDPVLQKKSMKDYKNLKNEIKSNFNFVWSTPKNVDEDLYGNTWHWLMDQFNPLENFKTNFLYDDFSTPCFDGKHQMILGGSFISCGNEASHFSRFHFRPHFYQHSGFRMAYSLDGSDDNFATKLSLSDNYVHPKRLNILDQMEKNDWWKNIVQPLEFSEEENQAMFDQSIKEFLLYQREEKMKSPMGEAHDPKNNSLKDNFTVPYVKTKNFPNDPTNFGQLLKTIFKDLAPLGQKPGHQNFAAYVAGSSNPISNMAQFISQGLNQYTGHYMMAPGLVTIEEEAIEWFLDLFGFDTNKSSGFFTTGSSLASLSAIMMARKKYVTGYDLGHVTGYISSEGHHSILKNWSMLGFKNENLKIIKSKNFKMDIQNLESEIIKDIAEKKTPMIIFSTLGTTKTGSVDEIDKINEVNKKFQLWHHLDGAYGALFTLVESKKKLFNGINIADSLSLDLHKSFSHAYGTGMLIVKNKENMIFDYLGDSTYMPPKPNGHLDFSEITPELSRDNRGLRVWLPIKTLGIGPFILNLNEKINLAKWFSEELSKLTNLEIVSLPELSIFTFRHIHGDDASKLLLEKINDSGKLFLSSCIIDNKFTLRVCLLSHQLHFENLENALLEIKKILSEK